MTKRVEAEFYTLYHFKEKVKKCVDLAAANERDAIDMSLPASAFTKLDNAKKLQKAWNKLCDSREMEAAEVRGELKAMAKLLVRVAELYGWTDEELAALISRVDKLK